MKIPHPIPYQGSKRNIAAEILKYFPRDINALLEPFAGSAAISLASAGQGLARRYVFNDLNEPLMRLWERIIDEPGRIADEYETLWREQQLDPRAYYDKVRDRFNGTGDPACFLYLLARCVKASVRYNANGEFNQSPDNRRRGARPSTMRTMIFGASYLLKGRSQITSTHYLDALQKAASHDLVYMDPPYQGVCRNRDSRYLTGVRFNEFVDALDELNRRQIRFVVSYDGRTGDKMHGSPLPGKLNLTRVEIAAGRSTQATLLGREDVTVESLYLSSSLTEQLFETTDGCRNKQGMLLEPQE